MKKILFVIVLVLILSGSSFAAPFMALNWYLSDYVTSKAQAKDYLKIFAKDVGQAISGGSYGGSSLDAFGGINFSIRMSIQAISAGNVISRRLGDSVIAYPIAQIEIPADEDVFIIARGAYGNDSYVFGGGARYRIFNGYDSQPTFFLQSLFSFITANSQITDGAVFPPHGTKDDLYNKFNGWNLKTGVSVYFLEVPYVKPYVFLNFDVTRLTALSSDKAGLGVTTAGVGYGGGGAALIDPIYLSFTLSVYERSVNYNFGINYMFR